MELNKSTKATSLLENDYIKVLSTNYNNALKTIEQEIAGYYNKYSVDGKLSMEAMSIKDRNNVTRLQKLQSSINDELNALNRGEPQHLASHLTEVYGANYNDAKQSVEELTDIGLDMFNRQAIYESSVSPLGKIALQSNAQAVKTNIQRALTQGIIMGSDIRTMSKNVQNVLETNVNNATRIVRTETNRIMNEARSDLITNARSKGIKVQKVWISTIDSRTRDSHLNMDYKTVDAYEPFIVNGYKMMKPMDSSMGAPAKEIVNCRCKVGGYLPEFETKADINYKEERQYKAESLEWYKLNKDIESDITSSMKNISKETGLNLQGLKFRLKTEDSYLRKIISEGTLQKPYVPQDVVRYTFTTNGNDLVKGIETSLKTLENEGYEIIKVKNTWYSTTNAYRGVNTNLRAPNGIVFEVQYHTPESFDLKNGVNHKLYEKWRLLDEKSDEAIRLNEQMFENSSKLKIPKDIADVKNVSK